MENLSNIEKMIQAIKSNNELIEEIKKISSNLSSWTPNHTVGSILGYIDDVRELDNKIQELQIVL